MSYGTITTAQQVDFLYKKLGYSVAKTDNNARAASSEGNASPFLTLGTAVYQQDYLIPTYTSFGSMITGGNSTVSKVWTVQTRNNPGSVAQATWMTDKTDWIPVSLGGQGYQVGVYTGPPGLSISSLQGSSANPNGPPGTVAVPINGVNSDSWFFDYQSGILNFVDVNVPTSVANVSNVVYITGAVYSGVKGITTFPNLTVSGNITTGNISVSGYIYGNLAGNLSGNISGNLTGNIVGNVITAYQPYITSVGTLTNLTVAGNTTTGNAITTGSFYGNIVADTISPYQTNVVVFTNQTAVKLPSGDESTRPVGVAGYFRYNSHLATIEYYDGTAWVALNNQIIDQKISPDGINNSFTLTQTSTAAGLLVSINGTMQTPGVAYTVSGTTITFAEIPQVTDLVDVRFIASAGTTTLDYAVVDTGNILVGTSNVILDSFSQLIYRSAKYTISSTSSSNATAAEVIITQMGSSVAVSTIANVNTGTDYLNFYANISGTTVNFIAKGTASSNQLRIQRTYFNV